MSLILLDYRCQVNCPLQTAWDLALVTCCCEEIDCFLLKGSLMPLVFQQISAHYHHREHAKHLNGLSALTVETSMAGLKSCQRRSDSPEGQIPLGEATTAHWRCGPQMTRLSLWAAWWISHYTCFVARQDSYRWIWPYVPCSAWSLLFYICEFACKPEVLNLCLWSGLL